METTTKLVLVAIGTSMVVMMGLVALDAPPSSPPPSATQALPPVQPLDITAHEGEKRWSWGPPPSAPSGWVAPPASASDALKAGEYPSIGPAVAGDPPVPADVRGASWVFERHPEQIDACLASSAPPEDVVAKDAPVTFLLTVSGLDADQNAKMTGIKVLNDPNNYWTPMLGCLAEQFQGARFEAPESGVATLTWTLRRP